MARSPQKKKITPQQAYKQRQPSRTFAMEQGWWDRLDAVRAPGEAQAAALRRAIEALEGSGGVTKAAVLAYLKEALPE